MRKPKSLSTARPRPHIALLIETSLASGRDILSGIARYVREHEPWALYQEPHGLEESMPRWLHRWQGNGIIARSAADHLLERGLRNFEFCGIEGENWSQQRYAGLCAAVAGVQGRVALYELPRDSSGSGSWERVRNALARWIRELPKPTGVLVCSDQRGPQFLEHRSVHQEIRSARIKSAPRPGKRLHARENAAVSSAAHLRHGVVHLRLSK